jgi:hypothetical protein
MDEREQARRAELQAMVAAGKAAEAKLKVVDAGPGPKFFAACRAVTSGDTPAVVDAVRRTPALRQDVERIEAEIIAGRRAIRLPLSPPAGELEPGPHMIETIHAALELRLSDADLRAAVAGRLMTLSMARVGALMAEQRDDRNRRAARPRRRP